MDPFAGGGSIPLEAQRLGLEAHASDLNPVAVLINKALIEIPSQWIGRHPVHPQATNRTRWGGAEGLAEDVRRYGGDMLDRAAHQIGSMYPDAVLADGSSAPVIAWIWARTISCPNPACSASMPLVSNYWLGKKKGKETWIFPVVEGGSVRFEIGHGPGGPPDVPKVGRGAKFRCIVCGELASDSYTHDEIDQGRSGAQLLAIAAEGDRCREYLPANEEHDLAACVDRPAEVPSAPCRGTFGGNALGRRYGFHSFADYFSNRQLVMLGAFSELVKEVALSVEADARRGGLDPSSARDYSGAIATYLAFSISKLTDFQCTLATWSPSTKMEAIRGAFSRQAVSMTWDFAEGNPFGGSGGGLAGPVNLVSRALEGLSPSAPGMAQSMDARLPSKASVIATDPPYYDNIGYADLSDFFYVWLRRMLSESYPSLFETVLTPKSPELIASPYRHDGSRVEADRYFESGFVQVFSACRDGAHPETPMSLFYAFKQAEVDSDGIGSTGWSTMLEGLAAAGWMVTATWPMRTERGARSVAIGTNSLASSVVLACRPRPETAGVTDRQGLVRSLREELPLPIRELQKAHIAPVDLRQAAIGPGMAIFSRFARVIEPDGNPMRVRTALGMINQVLDEVLGDQESEFDEETRWAINWFSQFFFDEGPYGIAEQLAVSMNVAVSGMVEAGILKSGGGRVHLLSRDELPTDWDPVADLRTPVWEATQHLVKRLETEGETSAARLLRRMGGLGMSAQLLAYRLYTLCERTRPNLAGPYNALVASWPEIQRLAREASEPFEETEQQRFEV